MAGDKFEVTTESLRATADTLGDRAATAAQIADKATAADVGARSWGALGLSLGLYAGYTSARESADRSIGEVKTFLADAGAALQNTARDYDEADRAGGAIFADIGSGLTGRGGTS